jgi:hypothetical protein
MKRTRALLIACAFLLTAAAARPAKSDTCQYFRACEDCPNQQGVHLCTFKTCGTVVVVSCAPCSGECFLPAD